MFAFENAIDLKSERMEKPRSTGLNWAIDWGWGLSEARDVIELVGTHIDIIKFPALSLRIQSRDILKRKLQLFRENNILAFPGGMLLEVAAVTNQMDPFLDEAEAIGISVLEVSESEVQMAPEIKMGLIEKCAARGFKVLGELGPHHADKPFEPIATISECKSCLDAGAWLVILEGEVVQLMKPWEDPAEAEVIDQIVEGIGLENVMFELVGSDVRSATWYVKRYGPNANIGNIGRDAAGVMIVEHVRRALRGGNNWAWAHELNS